MTPDESKTKLPGSVGLILAAGRGRRMGAASALSGDATNKLLLPLRGRHSTVIESAFNQIAPYTTGQVFVIVGHERHEVVRALCNYSAAVFIDGEADADMFDSVKVGLKVIHARVPECEYVLIHPGDVPLADAGVVEGLIQRLLVHDNESARGRKRILIPTCGSKGGHPIILSARVLPDLMKWSGLHGLKGFCDANPSLVRRIEFPQANMMLHDVDTPEDYQRVQRMLQ